MISSRTSVFGLIGDPLDHSISPQIQNAAYEEMGLDAVYVCFRIQGSVPKAVRSASMLGIRGLNVTIPYKSKVLTALDRIDDVADQIGAVNVINFGKMISGHNTDVTASLRSLKESIGGSLEGLSVTLVGAGGSARAVSFGLAREGCKVAISNRTISRAQNLAEEIETKIPGTTVTVLPLTRMDLERAIDHSDVLINATPVGMYPSPDQTIADSSMLHPDLVVMDLVYNPQRTKLLFEAQGAGCRTVGGLRMLAYQAADSIRIWTGRRAPIDAMMQAARRALETFPRN